MTIANWLYPMLIEYATMFKATPKGLNGPLTPIFWACHGSGLSIDTANKGRRLNTPESQCSHAELYVLHFFHVLLLAFNSSSGYIYTCCDLSLMVGASASDSNTRKYARSYLGYTSLFLRLSFVVSPSFYCSLFRYFTYNFSLLIFRRFSGYIWSYYYVFKLPVSTLN
jgi:hypothetical protein